MLRSVIKVPAQFEYVFPHGLMFLGVEPAKDFDRRGQGDDQERDKESGERLWVVTGLDNDPDATRFGRSAEVRVKVAAPYAPVPPAPQYPGMRPLVGLADLVLTPYVDRKRCKSERCGCWLGYAYRASGLIEPALPAVPPAG
jgi:hypothetical protein